jgi:hypothetical protein
MKNISDRDEKNFLDPKHSDLRRQKPNELP